jgi:hypothetical protein
LIGGDVVAEQQKKILDQVQAEFEVLRGQKNELTAENTYKTSVIGYYDELTREMMPPLVRNRLGGYRLALVVTGGSQLPPEMLNTLGLAGAQVTSTTVFLPDFALVQPELRLKVCQYLKVPTDTPQDELQKKLSSLVAQTIVSDENADAIDFLKSNHLVKMNGQFGVPVNGVIVVGGANNVKQSFPASIDVPVIETLGTAQVDVYGVEAGNAAKSHMEQFQKYDITTVDDIDLTVGQIALVLAMSGEPGNYGIKKTAQKFMPALPVEYLGGVTP